MNSSESWRFKELALAVVACFFLAVPAPVSATSFPQTTDATIVVPPIEINVNTTLKLGLLQAPTAAGSPSVFFITHSTSICGPFSGDGACLTDGTRTSGFVEFTGAPNDTVFVSSTFGSPTTTTLTGNTCTGGVGATPVVLTNIYFSVGGGGGAAPLGVSGTSEPVGIGGWFAVWDTSDGTWTCTYDIIADY